MYPIIKGNWATELQYWSATHIAPGSIIKTPLRGKSIPALVFSSVPLSEAKALIKDAEFKTRKINSSHVLHIVRPEYIRAVQNTSSYFVQNFGAMLRSAIPACAFSYSPEKNSQQEQDDPAESKPGPTSSLTKTKPFDLVAISVNTEDRMSSYKSMIREELARKKSVLMIAPTTRTTEMLFDAIKKGIEHVVIMIHGGLTKKKIDEAWKQAIEQEKNVVIIVTPQFLSVPRKDIETIILEGESSRAYRTFHVPYYDWRKIAENYARELHCKLVYGDQLLSFEALHRIENFEINEIFPVSYRIQQETETIVVDMIENKRKTSKFEVLSEELVSMIEYAQKKKQNMFIFASRRGLSPQIVCGDCGNTVICKTCNAPVVLHTSKKGVAAGADKSTEKGGASGGANSYGGINSDRFFLCHHCGRERGALEACIKCESWNLVTLGIGTDTVYEEIEKRFPDLPIFKIDKDSAKNDKDAKKIAADFQKENGAVLIGTETALSYIEKVKLVSIASMDSLFSIPDFRINERIAHILLRLIDIAESYLLIQTRNADTPIIKAISAKTLADFVKEEMSLREALNYPPYTIMGKVSLMGPSDSITRQAKKIEVALKDYEPLVFPAMIPAPRGKGSIINITFTLPSEIWNKETRTTHELWKKLSVVSEVAPIQINPESFI